MNVWGGGVAICAGKKVVCPQYRAVTRPFPEFILLGRSELRYCGGKIFFFICHVLASVA